MAHRHGANTKPALPPKPTFPIPAPRPRLRVEEDATRRAFNDDVGQGGLPLGNKIDEIKREICKETAEKVRSIQIESECQRMDLKPLKSEYTARYNRLILNVKSLRGNNDRKVLSSAVAIETIHETASREYSPVVLMVGGPGEGKTASVVKYANRALERQIFGPRDIEVIIFIQGKDINMYKDCTPFELLFSKQFANILTSDEVKKDLEDWVTSNPSQILVIIDGINEISNFSRGMNARIQLKETSPPLTILLNILRQHIYRGMWVVCTTTPQWIWKLDKTEIPSLCIEICGFKFDEVTDILSELTDQREAVSELMTRFPNIKKMCKTPAILLHLAKEILQQGKTLTESRILLEILSYLDTQHTADRITARKTMNYVMQVAHNAAKDNRIELRADETSSLDDDISLEIAHFISAMPAQNYSLVGKHTTNQQLRYEFNSTALRDTLAAIYSISISSNGKLLMQEALKNPLAFRFLAIAFIVDEDDYISNILMSFSSKLNFTKLSKFRKNIREYLESKTADSFTDTSWIRILTQCKGHLSHMSKITAIKLTEDCDGTDILSVGHLMPSLSKISTRGCMTIHSSSLALLKAKFSIKMHRLRITGNMQNESQTLSEILSTCNISDGHDLLVVDFAEISDYGMDYDIQTRVLRVGELHHEMVSIIIGLFHFIDDSKTVRVKLINMENLTKARIKSFLEELNSLAKHCSLEVAKLYCPGQGAVPPEILSMLTVTSTIHAKSITYGDVTCTPCKHQVSSGARQSYLEINGSLTASTTLVSLIKTGKWNGIRTADFRVGILFETEENGERLVVGLNVRENNPARTCYQKLIQLMIELGAGQMSLGDISVYAEYNRETDKLTKMSVTQVYARPAPEKRYSAIATTLFERDDDCILEFESLKFKKESICPDRHGNQPQFAVIYLNEESLTVLQCLLRGIELPPLQVKKCELRKNDIPRLQRLSPNILQIDHLLIHDDSESVTYLPQLYNSFKCNSLVLRKGNVTVWIKRNDADAITIDTTSVEQLGNIYESLTSLFRSNMRMRIMTLTLSLPTELPTCQRLFRYFIDAERNQNRIMIQIDTLITNGSPANSLLLCLGNESRFLKIALIKVRSDITITFKHSEIANKVEINRADAIFLSKIRGGLSAAQKRYTILVEECNVPDLGHGALMLSLNDLKKCFASEESILNITYLYFARFDVGVLKSLNEELKLGQVQRLEFNDERYCFSIGRHPAKYKSLLGVIDKISTKELQHFIDEMGVCLPTETIVKQCTVGRDDEDIKVRFTGPDDDFQKQLMEFALQKRQEETVKELDTLKEILNQQKGLRIETLTVNGQNEDMKLITDAFIGESTQNASPNHIDQVRTIKLQTVSLDNHQIMGSILNSGHSLEANCLRVDKTKDDFTDWLSSMHILKNEHFKVSTIKFSCKLNKVLPTLTEIYNLLTPEKISADDGEFQIKNHPYEENKKLLIAIKGDANSDEVQQLSEVINAEISENQYLGYELTESESGYEDCSIPLIPNGVTRMVLSREPPPLPSRTSDSYYMIPSPSGEQDGPYENISGDSDSADEFDEDDTDVQNEYDEVPNEYEA